MMEKQRAEARMKRKCVSLDRPARTSPASALLAKPKGRMVPIGKRVIGGMSAKIVTCR